MDKPTLTPRQEETLRIITTRQVMRTTGPTVREVAEALGVAGNAAQGFIRKLREAGLIHPDLGYGLVCVDTVQPNGTERKPLAKPGGKLL